MNLDNPGAGGSESWTMGDRDQGGGSSGEMNQNQDNSWSSPTSTSPKGTDPKGGNRISIGNNSSSNPSRRNFTTEFKLRVLEAFNTDPECIGNQRATARKFGIHRRQVQKWLQQPQTREEPLEDNSREELPTSSKEKENPPDTGITSTEQISPSRAEDLSKLSASAMALSLNLSMNMNPVTHSSPLPFSHLLPPLHLQPPSRISPSPTFNHNGKGAQRNESPANLSNSSGASQPPGSNDSLDVVDEIAYMYPQEDFNLLRQAMIRNDVTFTKIQKKVTRPPHPPQNNSNVNVNGRSPSNRVRVPFASPPPPESPQQPKSSGTGSSAQMQQAYEFIRQQNDYVKFLQQSGLNLPFNGDLQHFSELRNPKYSPWLQQNAHLLSGSSFGIPSNMSKNLQSPVHGFASPKIPSNAKPKTVAAALAASRLSPSLKFSMNEPPPPKSRNSHKRKRQPRQARPSPPAEILDEEFIDPTSMLEVTSSAVEENGVDLSNHYKSNGHDFGNHVVSAPSQTPPSSESFTNHKNSPERPLGESDSEVTKYLALQAYVSDPEVAGDARALARKFGLNVRVVMKWIKEGSFKFAGNSVLPNPVRLNGGSDSLLNLASIANHISNSTVGLNGNSDLSMLRNNNSSKEHSSDIVNYSNLYGKQDLAMKYYETDDLSLRSANLHKNMLATISSSTNKRKNSKPNQICDFSHENSINFNEGPVDMIVPIKKRRRSTSTQQE